MKEVQWLIIDWGTTNFRAFAIGLNDELLDTIELKRGLLNIKREDFQSELKNILSRWLSNYHDLPIYMAGMVGSAQGWVNVPYVEAPVLINDLINNRVELDLPWGSTAYFIPGISYERKDGCFDVMRGEEVQLFGLQSLHQEKNCIAIFPGTHSKHIVIINNKVEFFSTFMTGELYSILSEYSILGKELPEQISSTFSFKKGIKDSGGSDFTSKLFLVRTNRLFSILKEHEVLEYLSGLLIGQELKTLESESVYLVGGELLCQRYAQACEILNIKTTILSGDEAFLTGMFQIKKRMTNEKSKLQLM